MDINRISIYLSGRFPPYYKESFDKYELIEIIKAQSLKSFSDDFFKFIDSKDFYSMVLNSVKRTDEKSLISIIKILDIPEDAGGLSKKDLIEDKLIILKAEYETLKKIGTAKGDVQKRGYEFEKWLVKLFDLFRLAPRTSYKTDFDQIDGSFELDGKEYLLEAKWLGKEADTGVIDKLFARLDRCLIGTVGLAISQSGFTDNSKQTANMHKNLLLLDGNNIEDILSSKINLDELIRKIRRNMAEEGKCYI